MVDTNKYCLWDGCKPYTGNGCRSFAAIENFKPQPYWELQTLYRDILLVMKKAVFKKEDGELLANKVKESDFEIVSIEKRKGVNMHQSYLI
jgi:DNA topoisomerase IA